MTTPAGSTLPLTAVPPELTSSVPPTLVLLATPPLSISMEPRPWTFAFRTSPPLSMSCPNIKICGLNALAPAYSVTVAGAMLVPEIVKP